MSEFYRVYNSCYETDCDCSALHKMPNWRKTFCMNETSSKRSEEGRTAIEYSLEAEAMVFM